MASPDRNRRAALRLMGSTLAAVAFALVLPRRLPPRPHEGLPGAFGLPVSWDMCRHARRRAQVQPCGRPAVDAAHAYLRAPKNAAAAAHFDAEVRRDFVAGRVAVVRGWVIAETELALLSLVEG